MKKVKIITSSMILAITMAVSAGTAMAVTLNEPPQSVQNEIGEKSAAIIHDHMLGEKDKKSIVSALYWGGKKWANAEKFAYIFIDPNCVYCHHIYNYLNRVMPQLKKNGIQPVIIPVAFLKESSATRAAQIIKEGWEAYKKNEENFKVGTESGGIGGLTLTRENIEFFYAVKSNLKLFRGLAEKNGFSSIGTPFVLVKDRYGNWQALLGYPKNDDFFTRIMVNNPKVPWDGKTLVW